MLRDKDSGAFKGCVFVKFMYRQDAINATLSLESYDYKVEFVSNLDNSSISRGSVSSAIEKKTPSTNPKGDSLYLQKLPLHVDETALLEKFSAYGKITALNLLRNDSSGMSVHLNSRFHHFTLTHIT